MQRIRLNGIKQVLLWLVLPILSCVALITLDQLTKMWFTDLYNESGNTMFIEGLLSFTYTVNTGSAFSFLADVEWGQIFLKILTCFSLIIFVFMFIYSISNKFKTLTVSVVLIISGTIGNFIDRLLFNGVCDFIKFEFINFPIFNLADTLLTFGVIVFIVHFCFLDSNAIFKKSNQIDKKEEKND